MEDKNKHKEICELLKIWFHLKDTCWSGAKQALEQRINLLITESGLGKKSVKINADRLKYPYVERHEG